MTILTSDCVLYANGSEISLCRATDLATPTLTIGLDSEIHALAAYGMSTVVAATALGLIALEIAYTPTNSSWLNRTEARFTTLRYFALGGTEHATHQQQASMIRR